MARGDAGPVPALRQRVLVALVAPVLLLAACGDDDQPELTFEDRLVQLEGRPLTPAEVAERAEVGETVCRLDDRILDEMWQQLSEDQLDFQDIVIASICPERAVLYAGHTGRFVTEEAEESGVRTSTTRTTSTTATTAQTNARPSTTTIGPTTSAGSPSGSSSPTSDRTTTEGTAASTPPSSVTTPSSTATGGTESG